MGARYPTIALIVSLVACTGADEELTTTEDAVALPTTGTAVAALAPFDNAMQTFMAARGIPAGTIAILRDGRVVFERGYGNAKGATPIKPTAIMRWAGQTKTVLRAAVLKAIANGKLSWTRTVYPLLALPAFTGDTVDVRINTIDLWDLWYGYTGFEPQKTGIDPMFDVARQIGAKTGSVLPPTREDIARYMMGQPLQYNPGDTSVAISGQSTNFSYMLMSLALEKTIGRDWFSYAEEQILRPPGIVDVIDGAASIPANPREPDYHDHDQCFSDMDLKVDQVVDCTLGGWSMEDQGGDGDLVGSARALAQLLNKYNASGSVRATSQSMQATFGAYLGAFSFGYWRGDGHTVVAVLFNQAEDSSGLPYTDIQTAIESAAKQVTQWP